MPAAPNATGGSSALQNFFSHGGWQEAGILGIGARGPVLLVSSEDIVGGSPKRSALKRSSADEVRALNALARCRNIVTLQEHFAGDNCSEVWARLEWLEGGSLRNLLRSQSPGRLNEDAARFVLAEILFALQEIHQLRWMHRDVKAENIGLTMPVFTESGQAICRVKLMDFDTAVPVSKGEQLTEVVGTVENMAPEVFDGSYDEVADCWSLGVVAYEMLFGYRPFNDVCIDNVEEMVRNWRRYLMIPSDAGTLFSDFVSRLLSAQQDRMSSAEASTHQWLRSAPGGANGPACTAAAASAISEATRRQSSTLGCQTATLRPCAPVERRATVPELPCGFEELSLSKLHRRYTVPAGNVDEKEAVESLKNLRSLLAEWSAPSLGTVYSSSSPGNATARVLPTASDADAKWSGSQSARRLDRSEKKCTADSASAEIGSARRGLDAEGSRGTARVQGGQRWNRPKQDAKTASTPGQAAGGSLDEKEGAPIELTPTPKGVSGHLEYLRRVRSRTQEVVEIAEAISARCTRPVPGSSTVDSRSERHVDTSSPSASSSRRGSDPDKSRFPTDCIFRPGEDSLSSASASEHLEDLEHLKSARARNRDLLSRLSKASTEAKALPTQFAAAAAEPRAKVLRESQQVADAPAIDSAPQDSRQQRRSSSPNSWLIEQRHRMDVLLARVAAAAEKPGGHWAGHVAGHLPSRADVDAGTAWPSAIRQQLGRRDLGRDEQRDKADWVSA